MYRLFRPGCRKTASPNRHVLCPPSQRPHAIRPSFSSMGSCYYVRIGLRRRPRCKRSTIKLGAVEGRGVPGVDQILLRRGKRHVISACPLPASHPSSLRSRLTIRWRNTAKCSLRPDR